MTRSTRHDRAALAATLARQYQVISRSQAVAHGMTSSALRQRLRPGGPWQRLLPGVFLAVTGTPTTEQRSVAALLYAGTGGLVTGAAAVGLWGVQAPRDTMIDVLIPATIRSALAAAASRPRLPIRTITTSSGALKRSS